MISLKYYKIEIVAHLLLLLFTFLHSINEGWGIIIFKSVIEFISLYIIVGLLFLSFFLYIVKLKREAAIWTLSCLFIFFHWYFIVFLTGFLPYINKYFEKLNLCAFLFVVLFFIVLFFLLKSKKGTLITQFATILLLLFNCNEFFLSFNNLINKIPLIYTLDIENSYKAPQLNDYKPNIYFFLLDSYTSDASLLEFWNYKNDLSTHLEKSNFKVVHNGKAPYNATIWSMNSIFNMNYFDNESIELKTKFYRILYCNNIKNSFVFNYFYNNGYTINNASFFDLSQAKKRFP
jgi:hypothetical protein